MADIAAVIVVLMAQLRLPLFIILVLCQIFGGQNRNLMIVALVCMVLLAASSGGMFLLMLKAGMMGEAILQALMLAMWSFFSYRYYQRLTGNGPPAAF